MILIFKKLNGERVAVDVDSILEINEKPDYTEIKTVVRNIKIDHDFEQIVELVVKYQSNEYGGSINFSKN